jgi:hypothetical protein
VATPGFPNKIIASICNTFTLIPLISQGQIFFAFLSIYPQCYSKTKFTQHMFAHITLPSCDIILNKERREEAFPALFARRPRTLMHFWLRAEGTKFCRKSRLNYNQRFLKILERFKRGGRSFSCVDIFYRLLQTAELSGTKANYSSNHLRI